MRLLALLFAVLAIVTSACGSGNDDSSTNTTAVTTSNASGFSLIEQRPDVTLRPTTLDDSLLPVEGKLVCSPDVNKIELPVNGGTVTGFYGDDILVTANPDSMVIKWGDSRGARTITDGVRWALIDETPQWGETITDGTVVTAVPASTTMFFADWAGKRPETLVICGWGK